MAKALDEVRVLDLSTSMSGAWCSRLLGDFGAEVIHVEPPDGSPLRRLGPFDADGGSIPARYVLANKRSVILDAGHPEGRRALNRLLRWTLVVVESGVPGTLDRWGVGLEAREERWPRLVLASITPHGQDGGREHAPGNDLTAYARSGWASINGLADREPLKGSGFTASFTAGLAAYGAVVAAVLHRGRTGEGQHVDVSEVEALAETFAPSLLRGQYGGEPQRRKQAMNLLTGPVPVQDGHFALTLSRAHFWRDAMNELGLHDLAEDRRFDAGWYRAQHQEEFVPRVHAEMAKRTKMGLFEALARLRVVAGPVLDVGELAENEHLEERGFYAPPADDPDGPRYAGAPFKMSATPWALERRAPKAGEHTAAVLRDVAGYSDGQIGTLAGLGALG